MNKSVAMVVVLSAAGMQAMETSEANFWSITIGTTKINVIKGFVGDAGDRVRTIVVGRNQQQELKEPNFGDSQNVGRVDFLEKNIIYKKSKDDESASDDDTYKPYEYPSYFDKNEKKKVWKRASKIKVKADVVTVIEPRIMKNKVCDSSIGDIVEVPCYYAQRKNPEEENSFFGCEEIGEEAIKEASKDLIRCYWNSFLEVGLHQGKGEPNEILRDVPNKEHSIAFQALSAEVGFPRAIAAFNAARAICKFISDCPLAYDVIELFVKKRSEFDLYKKYLATPLEHLWVDKK